MSLYTPFNLVHAHLPHNPSSSTGVPEVAVPSERSFPPTDETYEAPLFVDHAVSAAFDSQTGTLARSIYNGYALELRSLSPVTNGRPSSETSAVRILFPDRLLPLSDDCVVVSLGTRQLVVMVITEANIIYRLTFPLGSFVDLGDRLSFNTKNSDWAEEWEIEEDGVESAGGIGSWAVTNEDTVVLGCADGGIIKVERNADSTQGEFIGILPLTCRKPIVDAVVPPRPFKVTLRLHLLPCSRRTGHLDCQV